MALQHLFPNALLGFESKTVDSRFQLRHSLGMGPAYSDSLIHINIDNYSKQQSGNALWEKASYAKLIQRIGNGNPGAIACDIMFVEWGDTKDNDLLIDSIIAAGSMVSPYLLEFSETSSAQPAPSSMAIDINPKIEFGTAPQAAGVQVVPLNELLEQSAGLGFVNMIPDQDGVIRRVPMLAELDGFLVPSIFLQALTTFLDYDLENINPISKSQVILKNFPDGFDGKPRDLVVPLDGQGNLIVNLAGPLQADIYKNSYSAWDLMQSTKQPDFSGKLVFLADISAQSNQYGDVSPVPLDSTFPRPYIWSNAASSVLNAEFILPFGNLFTVFASLLLCGVLVLASLRANTHVFSLVSIGSVIVYTATVYGLFVTMGWLLPLLPVLLSLIAVYIFTSIYRYTQIERYKGVLEGSLESYLSPVLMNRIRSNPDMLKLGGERKRITVLFSDIVNFTSFSDEADPEEIQEVLETYFSDAASIIFAEDGIIDKYMGDGILAFFENNGEEVGSAERAVKSALSMQEKATNLDKLYREQNRFPFAIRVGLATGYAKVGNIGPAEKIDYTVIGSVVNLAARLQGVGEPGDVIVDSDTFFHVKDVYKHTSLGSPELKGFSNPVEVFSVHK